MSAFSDDRDASAQSRVDLWRDSLTLVEAYPILGVGPDHFPLVAEQFGWSAGKEAHSLWLQAAAETGIPGGLFLLGMYLFAMLPMLRVAKAKAADPWIPYGAYMVFASMAGFLTSAQFVTVEGLETPLYVVQSRRCRPMQPQFQCVRPLRYPLALKPFTRCARALDPRASRLLLSVVPRSVTLVSRVLQAFAET
jgi:hypothetical protein